MTDLFYMLLRQMLSGQTEKEMEETVKTVFNSEYVNGAYSSFQSEADRELLLKLKQGAFREIAQQRRKQQLRDFAVGALKKTFAYRVLRGSNTRRVKW
jgi:hypothetical protein